MKLLPQLLPRAREAKSGVQQLVHCSVCLSVPKRQFMIEKQLNLNLMLYFEHETEKEPAV